MRGLRADQRFERGDVLTEYAGVHRSCKFEVARLEVQTHVASSKAGGLGNPFWVDGDRVPEIGRGGGSFANHDARPNAQIAVRGEKLVLIAEQAIAPGEEILLRYGSGGSLAVAMGDSRFELCVGHDGGPSQRLVQLWRVEQFNELHERGFTRFGAGELRLALPSVEEVLRTAWEPIFNTRDGGGTGGGRWHGRAESWASDFETSVRVALGGEGLNWLAMASPTAVPDPGGSRTRQKVVRGATALLAGVAKGPATKGFPPVLDSNATTRQQRPHADSAEPMTLLGPPETPWRNAPLVMIVALQDETPVVVFPLDRKGEREVVVLAAGEALIFRGDLIHCGAEFDRRNVRLHVYIDAVKVVGLYDEVNEREDGKTYLEGLGKGRGPIDVFKRVFGPSRKRARP